jgi:hypothetical protein
VITSARKRSRFVIAECAAGAFGSERDEERITLTVDLEAAVRSERGAKDAAVLA